MQPNIEESQQGRCPFMAGSQKPAKEIIADTPETEQVPHPLRASLPGIAAFLVGNADQQEKSARELEIEDPREIAGISYNLDLIRQMIAFPSDPRASLSWATETYGDAAQFVAPNGQVFHVHSDPEVIKNVLKLSDGARNDKFDKSAFLSEGVGWAMGRDNVLVSSNRTWKGRHQAMSPQLRRTNFESPKMVGLMQRVIDRTSAELEAQIKRSPDQEVQIDLQEEMSIVALRVALSGIFGIDEVSREELLPVRDAFRKVFAAFPYEAATPFNIPYGAFGMVVPEMKEIAKSKELLLDYADGLIERVKQNPSMRPNPISALLKARESGSGNVVPDEVIRAEVLTMLFAGHETTGNIFGWTFGALSERPELQTQLLKDTMGYDYRKSGGLGELQDNMPFVRQTVMESLRFFPPVYVLLRRATEDVAIPTESGTVVIPDETEVLMNIFDAQRSEKQWGVQKTGYPASEYHPARWSEENIDARGLGKDDLRIFSFGAGPRVCVGTHLFMTEAMLVLAHYTEKFQFEPLFDSVESGMTSDFTLQREGGFPAVARLRQMG